MDSLLDDRPTLDMQAAMGDHIGKQKVPLLPIHVTERLPLEVSFSCYAVHFRSVGVVSTTFQVLKST